MKSKIFQSLSFKLSIFTIFLISLAFAFFNSNFNTIAQQEPPLPEKINNLIEQSSLKDAFWSISIRDDQNRLIYDLNSSKLVTPASNLKVVSSAAVLDELGPDFKFTTKIYTKNQVIQEVAQEAPPEANEGKIEGTLNGDIYLVGYGDPSINGMAYGGERLYVFKKLIKQLKDSGITVIEGDLIANDGFFDRKFIPDGWLWDDLSFYYAAPIGALSFNNNCVDLEVKANGSQGARPKVSWFPFNTNLITVVNEQVITGKGYGFEESYERELGTNTIVLRSSMPSGYTEGESITVKDPTAFFADSLKKFMESEGITLKGKVLQEHTFPDFSEANGFKLLASHESVPVSELLKEVNKNSNNFYIEMLLKAAAAHQMQSPGSTKLGILLIENFLKKQEIEASKIHLKDASGLSPNNLVTTSLLSELLVKMKKHPHFVVYKKSLSEGGVDGSLGGRFGKGPLKSKFVGKTGYITGARALTGYLKTAKNQDLVVSVVTNHFTDKVYVVDLLHQNILEAIYASN
ncbi:MAG: D-alanyl-D-alanine carboxypeptidase/D-alanyl-D-alanine-endopeptidase [Candidatus Caenarcaniphilales bacterium]|nr:D-alanyl-D-alanine carboxypeptidase/D-alanyl-D-alanine-endopeptidase [Candidatus Caenarcaniphilales bacterium]